MPTPLESLSGKWRRCLQMRSRPWRSARLIAAPSDRWRVRIEVIGGNISPGSNVGRDHSVPVTRYVSLRPLAPQKGHGLQTVGRHMQAHGPAGLAESFLRQADVSRTVFDQENLYWRAVIVARSMGCVCRW